MKVYFDLDNVLAAFQKGGHDLCGITIQDQAHQTKEDEESMWAALRDCPHFYDRLEMMPGAKELWDYAYSVLGSKCCQILSAVPKEKHGILTATEDKISWCRRMLAPEVVVHIVHSKQEKKEYCTGADCILIDDLQANIDEWTDEAHGGTGILFTNAAEALKALKQVFLQAGTA